LFVRRELRVFGERPADKAISKAISGRGTGICYASVLCFCRAIGAFASENDTAGFELPIRKSGVADERHYFCRIQVAFFR
jgi:hypothetical protein